MKLDADGNQTRTRQSRTVNQVPMLFATANGFRSSLKAKVRHSLHVLPMGAWGYYNFDNDMAADFAGNFKANPQAETLRVAFDAVAEEEYLDADVAKEALAAAEIVAAVLGKPGRDFPADLFLVIPRFEISSIEPLRKPAQHAVAAVLREESELRQLWAEGDDFGSWQKVQHDLLHRLEEPA